MPAPKDPEKYREWIAKLKSAKNSGQFTKGHRRWDNPKSIEHWIKKGQRISPETEFKKNTGKYVDRYGYVCVYEPTHPLASSKGVVKEHRKVWYDQFGEIPEGFDIHHKNHNKQDNRIENLQLISKPDHALLHNNLRK